MLITNGNLIRRLQWFLLAAAALLQTQDGIAGQLTASEYIALSLERYKSDDFTECAEFAKAAITLRPDSDIAYCNLCAAYCSSKQWDRAIEAGRHAVRINPRNELAKNNLAWALQGKASSVATVGKVRTPEQCLEQSLTLNRAGKFRESIDAARQALELRPDYAPAYINICAGYASLREWDEAVKAGEQAVALDPTSALAKGNLKHARDAQRSLATATPRAVTGLLFLIGCTLLIGLKHEDIE